MKRHPINQTNIFAVALLDRLQKAIDNPKPNAIPISKGMFNTIIENRRKMGYELIGNEWIKCTPTT